MTRKSKKKSGTDKDILSESEGPTIFKHFYVISPKGVVTIHHYGLIEFLEKRGFFWISVNGVQKLVKATGRVLREVNRNDVTSFIKTFIIGLDRELGNGATNIDLLNTFIRGLQVYVNDFKLGALDMRKVSFHKDTVNESFFYFKNKVVVVRKNEILVEDYIILRDAYIWEDEIRNENISLNFDKSVYEVFIRNICNNDEKRFLSFCTIIGYFLHRFKDPANPVGIFFIDEKIGEVDDANGGSGKSLVAKSFEYIRNTVSVPGKLFKVQGDFAFQRVTASTNIVMINDIQHRESIANFFNIITDDWAINKKHKNEELIKFSDAPKIGFTTNVTLVGIKGESVERRVLYVEFSDHYNIKNTPFDEHGHRLFLDWDDIEFNKFYAFMFNCTQRFLTHGLIRPEKINIFEKQLRTEIGEEFIEFMEEKIANGVTKIHKKATYHEFIDQNKEQKRFYRSQKTFTSKVKQFLQFKKIKFDDDKHTAAKEFIDIIYDTKPTTISSDGAVNPVEVPNGSADPDPDPVKSYTELKDYKYDYKLIDKVENLHEVINILLSYDIIAVDTETTPFDVYPVELVGISLSVEAFKGFYIAIPEDKVIGTEILNLLKPLFENTKKTFVLHNAKYDLKILKGYGIRVLGQINDTLIEYYLLNPAEKKKGLKELSRKILNYQQIEIEDVIGHDKKHQISMRDLDPNEVYIYACEDADQTLQLHNKLLPLLIENNLMDVYTKIEAPLISIIADMEYAGIRIDINTLAEIEVKAEEHLLTLGEAIIKITNDDTFNVKSPQQVSDLLFKKLGLPATGKLTKNGFYKTDQETLQLMVVSHPIVPSIIDYKKTSKIIDTYLTKLPESINPITGRVHTNFNQTGTETGRLSSSSPNLQNIPKRSKGFGKDVRKAFVPTSENYKLIAADYSQIELRVMASMSKDETMINAFNLGLDIHTATASKIFRLPIDSITTDKRDIAKSINFGLNYGMTAVGLANRLTLSTGKLVSVAEAADYISTYFSEFPGILQFKLKCETDLLNNGFVQTMFNRKRLLPEIYSASKRDREYAKRAAVNTVIQGTAADIIKLAMIKVNADLEPYNTKMLLQVHDELVFDSPISEIPTVLPIIKETMENIVSLSVPILVSISEGNNWLEAH